MIVDRPDLNQWIDSQAKVNQWRKVPYAEYQVLAAYMGLFRKGITNQLITIDEGDAFFLFLIIHFKYLCMPLSLLKDLFKIDQI